jgi:hypothetical protein
MPSSFKVLFGDAATPADADFYSLLTTLEVEENADLPGAIELTLPISTTGASDVTIVGDARFSPYARIAVVVQIPTKPDACIFDGYVLSHRVHVDKGVTSASVRVWGQDVSCVMNLVERAKEWTQTDGTIANTIFGTLHPFGTAPANTQDDSGQHPESGHTVMQRGTDFQFLRERARRAGRLFRIACATQPGDSNNIGYFIKPDLDAQPAATLVLNPVESANIDSLDVEWDVARPTEVKARALLRAKDSVDGGVAASGLSDLDGQTLDALVGSHGMSVMLTASVDNAGELQGRARSILREAGWFVKAESEVDLSRLDTVVRAATVVQVNGAGNVLSGKYFVWSVRHTITAHSHRMKLVLQRNALGTS